jgi:hypothetical protein
LTLGQRVFSHLVMPTEGCVTLRTMGGFVTHCEPEPLHEGQVQARNLLVRTLPRQPAAPQNPCAMMPACSYDSQIAVQSVNLTLTLI